MSDSKVLKPAEKSSRIPPNAGKGRKAGVPNKTTREFRDTIRQLLERNAENVTLWLDQVAQDDPNKALEHIARLAEFAAPKMSRTEVVGDPDNPVQTVSKIELVPLVGK